MANGDIPITSRPQFQEQQGRPQLQVAAQRGSYLSALPSASGELTGLVNGLGSLNPALMQLAQQRQAQDAERETIESKAMAEQVTNPREVLTGAPIEGLTPPPAVTEHGRLIFQEGLAQRAAVTNKADTIEAYNSQKDQPDFNATAFLQEHRQQALAGLTDPVAVATIGAHYRELEALITADQEKKSKQPAKSC